MFKVESATVGTAQRIQIRKVLQKVSLTAKQGEELAYVPQFLVNAQDLANRAGGDAPRPARPDTHRWMKSASPQATSSCWRSTTSATNSATPSTPGTIWPSASRSACPSWNTLKRLLAQVNGLSGAEVLVAQVTHIEQQRQLLEEPDPDYAPGGQPHAIAARRTEPPAHRLPARHKNGMARLDADTNWKQLEPEQRNSLLSTQKLTLADAPKVQVANTDEVLATVDRLSLSSFADRVAAIDSRFDAVLVSAAELMEPKAQFVKLPSRTIKTDEDIEAWLADAKAGNCPSPAKRPGHPSLRSEPMMQALDKDLRGALEKTVKAARNGRRDCGAPRWTNWASATTSPRHFCPMPRRRCATACAPTASNSATPATRRARTRPTASKRSSIWCRKWPTSTGTACCSPASWPTTIC
jgi:hypothetical protein